MSKQQVSSTILWWLGWILLTIFSFFVSCFFWTRFIARHVGAMDQQGTPILWVTAVFGTWMIFLVPLIIVMYQKVDKAYEDARIARERAAAQKGSLASAYRTVDIGDSQRTLSQALCNKLKHLPETVRRGHLVTAILKNGRRVEHVFILNKKEVLGVYGLETLDFLVADIVDLNPANLDRLPLFETRGWLRLDGVASQGTGHENNVL